MQKLFLKPFQRKFQNPFKKILKLEEIGEVMLNPQPIGWERATELGMIDFCQWKNASEQEKQLPQFLHSQYELISKFNIFIIVLIILFNRDFTQI